MKILVIKRWFPFNIAKILQGHHFLAGVPKNVLADISFESGFQNTVLSSLVLAIKFMQTILFNEIKWQLQRPVISTIVDPYTSIFQK